MDDKLRAAVAKKLGVSDFEEQFIKSFRKVFGISPEIEGIDRDNIVTAHQETWALDGQNWLLWFDRTEPEWVIATPELFTKEL